MSSSTAKVDRLVLFNIENGDRRKFVAKSNDTASGGGARDLRFRPETEFLPLFRRMFPTKTTKMRSKGGASSQIEVLSGTVNWYTLSGTESANMEVWPSTASRPNESRLAKIYKYGLHGLIQNDPNGGRSVFLLLQQANGDLWLYFTTETSLLTQNWDPKIKKFAQDWFDDGCKSAFLDLVTNEQYPHV